MTDRQLRRRRNPELAKSSIVDALLTLVKQGATAPTTREIADVAGVSERTVFVHFPQRELLLGAAVEKQSSVVESLLVQGEPGASLDQRLDHAVAATSRIFALQRFVRVIGLLESRNSKTTDDRMRLTDRRVRDWLASLFANELENADTNALAVIEPVVAWPFRHHLIDRMGLSAAEADQTVRRTLLLLLQALRV